MGLHDPDLPFHSTRFGSPETISDVQNMAELERWTFHIQYPTHEF